ncbi:MAG: tRNA glutamyl-Q(34) synthetase GluQRS [Sphingomicrobium sp.]
MTKGATISRFAPSPTGLLHLGHAYSAALATEAERFLLRIEDLDPGRSRPEFVAAIDRDLAWLGLAPAEPPLVQSGRSMHYQVALDRLRGEGLAYACYCTRADIAAALTAPHGLMPHYPGICRDLPDDPARRLETPHSWRLDVTKALSRTALPTWREADTLHGGSRADLDDIVLARKDAPASYHLACVVDDAASGVTLVTRGEDLRPSTLVQRLLQTLLELPEPDYRHHRLVAHADGRRLAKRDQALSLAAMRAAGVDGPALVADLRANRLPLGFALTHT